jgi:hypothetical protein
MSLDVVFKLLEGLTALVTIVGLPLAIITFKQERERDRREMSLNRQQRRDQIFDELDQRYVEFMRLCAEHPELDVMELPLPDPYEPTPTQLRVEHALLAILLSLFESAFVMYEGEDSKIRRRQFDGWKILIEAYASRPSFRRVWSTIGPQFDKGFQKFMNGYIGEPAMTV